MKHIKSILLALSFLTFALLGRSAWACNDIAVQSKDLGYRNLYFLALCGNDSALFHGIQNTGDGQVVEISLGLAQVLGIQGGVWDGSPQGLIRNAYVRGGGPNKPMLLFFLQNGRAKGLWQGNGLWTPQRIQVLEQSLNRIPYEMLRKVSTQLLTFVARNEESALGIHVDLGLFDTWLFGKAASGVAFGPDNIILLTHQALDNSFVIVDNWGDFDSFLFHEVSHYLQYFQEGFYDAMCHTGNFASITWRNRRFLGTDIPCLFKKTDDQRAAYVSEYAMSRPAEDFADTLTVALNTTQGLLDEELWTTENIDEDPESEWIVMPMEILYFSKNPHLKAKQSYMTQGTTYGLFQAGLQQDGDADGVKWVPWTGGDCDDLNPAVLEGDCYSACDSQDDCALYFHCDLQQNICQPGCLVDDNCPENHSCDAGLCDLSNAYCQQQFDACKIDCGFQGDKDQPKEECVSYCEGMLISCLGPEDIVCGDGFVGPGEICDDGLDNGKKGFCTIDCSGSIPPDPAPGCGNAIKEPGEECDDGNQNEQDECLKSCKFNPDYVPPCEGKDKKLINKICTTGNYKELDSCHYCYEFIDMTSECYIVDVFECQP